MGKLLVAALAILPLIAPDLAVATPDDLTSALDSLAAPAPLVRQGRIEHHTPETLWERIDGEAELYKTYGYTASAHAQFADPEQTDRRVELSAFRFAEPLGAFGMFAAFRPPECVEQPLGNGGCFGDYQGFFWHGDLFVLADAAGPDAARPGDLLRVLESANARLGPPPPLPETLRVFSRLADTRTIRYQPQHLLGREALPPGLEGTARGTAVFLSVGPSEPGSLAAALEAYAGVLKDAVRGERGGDRTLAGRDPALGVVTLVVGARGIVGARLGPEAPGLWDLLDAIGAPGADPAQEGPR